MATKPIYPIVNTVTTGMGSRPFWSVMIPTYNCADYLIRTLESVLAQDPGPDEMQIEVVDDCSTHDDPETVVNRIGKGRVGFFRQEKNVGAPINFTTCINRSVGRWIHILHGDDEVLPGFYENYDRVIRAFNCAMVVGRSVLIDEKNFHRSFSRAFQKREGLLKNAQFLLAAGNEVRTPSVTVSRDVYEILGGFHPDLIHCCDWEMWARVASLGPVAFISHPYSLYREHPASDTIRLMKKGLDTTDAYKAIEIIVS